MALAERISPYADRLINDRGLREDIKELVLASRDAAVRARGQGRKKAARDPRVRKRLGEAAQAGRAALRALREPPPKPKGPRMARAAVLVGTAIGAFLALNPDARRQLVDRLGKKAGNPRRDTSSHEVSMTPTP